ncbi:unnamed protein product [Psylliodes chrysocephalus]|uniref:Uncharacterized protein n=1 Tax=Psylliodes chrysocephalus TaxID=3402493 RepID=A0A9P0CJZ8_9CUCU|nr:unnamed protein product [Psylliodes chrysocephala]
MSSSLLGFKVDHLLTNELDYELRVRGSVPQGTDPGKKKILRGALKQESMNRSVHNPVVTFTFVEEQKAIADTIADLSVKITDFNGLTTNFGYVNPDGLIEDDNNFTIEVKYPFVLKSCSIEQRVTVKKIKFLANDEEGLLYLRNTYPYYYQIQGQLHLSGKEYCYFIVWSPLGPIHVEEICRVFKEQNVS